MKRNIVMILTVLAAMLVFCLPVLYGQPAAPTEAASIDFIDGGAANKVVTFKHASHAKFACEECHHHAGDSQYSSCATAGCHDSMDRKDKSQKSFYNAIHGKGTADISSCVGCHREKGKTDEYKAQMKALTGCAKSACHP